MHEPSNFAVFGTFFAIVGGFVALFAYLLTRPPVPKGEGEAEREAPPAKPDPALLPLADATREKLAALDFEPMGTQFWECRVPEPGTGESVTYTLPDAVERMHELWINPEDATASPLVAGLEVRAVVRGGDIRDLAESYLLPEETVPGVVVELVRADGGGGRLRGQAPPEDVARCCQFLDPGLVAQLTAIPRASLEVRVPTASGFQIWVRWPEQNEGSGACVGDALVLLRAVAAKLR
jgi:hypothetical protein